MTRDDFADMCNRLGIVQAVEIGTDTGVFAAQFLSKFNGHWLWCVDPYLPYEEMNYDRQGDLLMAVNALMPYNGRVKLIKTDSADAAKKLSSWLWFKPGFIYIDGSHTYESVAADIETWWPLLLPGGIFGGHDYDKEHPGVVRAVNEFVSRHSLKMLMTQDFPPSWYVTP